MSIDKNKVGWPLVVGLGLLGLAYYVGTRPVGTARVIKAAAPVNYAARDRIKPRRPLVEDRAKQIEDYAQANPAPPKAAPSGTGQGTGYDTLGQDPSGL